LRYHKLYNIKVSNLKIFTPKIINSQLQLTSVLTFSLPFLSVFSVFPCLFLPLPPFPSFSPLRHPSLSVSSFFSPVIHPFFRFLLLAITTPFPLYFFPSAMDGPSLPSVIAQEGLPPWPAPPPLSISSACNTPLCPKPMSMLNPRSELGRALSRAGLGRVATVSQPHPLPEYPSPLETNNLRLKPPRWPHSAPLEPNQPPCHGRHCTGLVRL
jgi:hypothetical protein